VFFVYRPPEAFERILDYLSTGRLSFEGLSGHEQAALKANVDYFQVLGRPGPQALRWSCADLPYWCIPFNGDRSVSCISGATATTDLRYTTAVRATAAADSFKVRVDSPEVFVGFTTQSPCEWSDGNGRRHRDVTGWFLYIDSAGACSLFAQHALSLRSISSSARSDPYSGVGCTVTAVYDRLQREIRFEVDGKGCVGAYVHNIDNAEELILTPLVLLVGCNTATLV
jgi:hypothetical protein